ncbi:MAG: MerR family transcriptional regulator, partial [Bacilli bacterium]|nr:MerR family transcriptional regulator [Bacilli bacterium]
MFINEVEHIVGLSKKSIRYYEENGLLNPKRNSDNSYRIYGDEEIRKLKIIKFLRELDVPIRDLKLLNEGKITLQDCMEDRIKKIIAQEENYKRVKSMCEDIQKSKDSYEEIDITKYFQTMNTLNKEGFTMRKVQTSKTKKIIGAILSSSIFSLFFIFLISIISYFQFTEANRI